MIVVLDTNVILQARAPNHRYHVILQQLLEGRFALALSHEILLEYEEILTERAGQFRWMQFIRTLDSISAFRKSIRHIEPSFHFHLIPADPDDDKFADCAIAANADYLVTEDAHFDAMKTAGYKPRVISPAEFIALL